MPDITLNEYQREAMRTAGSSELAVLALGIAGEAGEVADLVKKKLGHGHTLTRPQMSKELGDVLWYIATLAQHFGLTLEQVAKDNMDKLRARYPNGFSVDRSVHRNEEEP